MYKTLQIYKPPKLVTQKTLREISPSNISPPGGLYLELPSNTKKNGKFPSKNKASPIDFWTQLSFRTQALPNISPSKGAFEKYTPLGFLSEFCGI